MKKMFFLVFLAFFGFGCKDKLVENPMGPAIMQEKFSVSQNSNKITCSQAEAILVELKQLYTNGGWPKGLEELIQEFASSADYVQWRELQIQDVNCWGLVRVGKCEEALKIAQEISGQIHAIVERVGREWNRTAAQYNINVAEFQKKTIEDLWMQYGEKYSSVDEWMKAFPNVNAYYRWSGGVGNLTMAQNAFGKGEYQGAKTWASWAVESFGWVLGYLSQQNL